MCDRGTSESWTIIKPRLRIATLILTHTGLLGFGKENQHYPYSSSFDTWDYNHLDMIVCMCASAMNERYGRELGLTREFLVVGCRD